MLRRICSCPTFAEILDFFHKNNRQCQFPNLKHIRSILCLRKVFAKLEDLCVVHVVDHLLRRSVSVKSFNENSLLEVILELLEQLFDRFCAIRVLLLDCRLRYA